MTRIAPLIAGSLLCLAAAAPVRAQDSVKVEAGLLECRGAAAVAYGFGSTRTVTCDFRPAAGVSQHYAGTLERAGIDFGVSDQGSMLWMVLATSKDLEPDALTGQYVGLATGAALGPGFTANVLVSKDAANGISLQPLSVSADSGLSVTLAGATLTLNPALPASRR
ncbi:DUF992 domain-containing protein [Aquabacter sp. L1I39]|uniref:DUF992 domain-containing protein n=1 Tax=Aquabacter sp. L1I39 TaxID=2820278 RepID=UPI001ADBBCFB|nr:DUF992 domain-containing protein [Aquabacter sp. L1I39]QTL03707.1 DUF992 domain-containing protein [Aquabacter sp. L1I39]